VSNTVSSDGWTPQDPATGGSPTSEQPVGGGDLPPQQTATNWQDPSEEPNAVVSFAREQPLAFLGAAAGAGVVARGPGPRPGTAPPRQKGDIVSLNPNEHASPAPKAPKEDASVADLFSDATTKLSTLMRQEIALAKAETRQEAVRAGAGAGVGAISWSPASGSSSRRCSPSSGRRNSRRSTEARAHDADVCARCPTP
jgi:hypothetical protein